MRKERFCDTGRFARFEKLVEKETTDLNRELLKTRKDKKSHQVVRSCAPRLGLNKGEEL